MATRWVATEIAEHLLGAGERRLGVDHPVDADEFVEAIGEGGGVRQRGDPAGEAQRADGEGGAQLRHEHVAEVAGEDPDRQEEAWRAGDPACLVRRDAAAGDNAV